MEVRRRAEDVPTAVNGHAESSDGSMEESVLVLEPPRNEPPPNFQPAPEEPPQQALHPSTCDEPFLFDSFRASSVGTIFESAAQSTAEAGEEAAAHEKYFTSSSSPNGLLRDQGGKKLEVEFFEAGGMGPNESDASRS